MINRDMQTVEVITYSECVDEYGQKRQGNFKVRLSEMVCKLYSQSNVDNPLFTNVVMIGLTKDKTITDKNVIKFNGNNYSIKYVIPSGQYNQILMMKE